MQTKLTQSFVQSIQSAERRLKVRDTLLRGLILFVDPSGKKTWYVDYRRPNGKRTDYKLGAAELFTVAEARDAAREFLASVALGDDPGEKKKKADTLRQLIEDIYAPWVLVARKSGAYSLKILKREFTFLYDIPVNEITVLQVERWRTARKQSGVKSATINRQLAALKAVLNWAYKSDIIPVNPLAKVGMLKERDSDVKVRYLSTEERERLMSVLDAREEKLRNERDSHNEWLQERRYEPALSLRDQTFADHLKPLVLLSLNTGIRRGALFSLEWRDVDFDNRVLRLRSDASKSGRANYIPLNETAFRTLQAWRNQTAGEGLVFPSYKTGGRMDNCNSAWEKVLETADIQNFRWHDMRHDFASRLVMAGVDLNTVRELLGHADIKMTLRYAHLAPQAKQAAVNLLK